MSDCKRLMGCDLSHHNERTELFGGLSFYFLKATEGKNYADNALTSLMVRTWDISSFTVNPIYGFYHYARPDINIIPDVEADHFLDRIKSHIGSCLMALDWEGKSLKCDLKWALKWLDYVKAKTGIAPFFYASASYMQSVSKYAEWKELSEKYPLWVAHYGEESKYSEFKEQGNIWQFTNTPCDLDVFYGNYMELALMAIKK